MSHDGQERMEEMERLRVLMRLSGAAETFDRLLQAVLEHLRTLMAVPPGVVDEVVEREFALVRERLQRFRPLFESRIAAALLRRIGSAQLPAVVAALEGDAIRHYFAAVRDLDREVARETQALSLVMKDVALFEHPASTSSASIAAPASPPG